MYVVKRPFKNFGETLLAGSIIDDPASIKRFRNKLAEGKIVEVTEANKDQYTSYFQSKYGVDITPAEEEATKTEKPVKSVTEPAKASVKVVAATIKQ